MSTDTMYPFVSFTVVPSARSPLPNYIVERLDLNCTQSLSSLSITHVVQPSFNITHTQQSHSFGNFTLNITDTQTLSEIIYHWLLLPGVIIVRERFPHFIEAQFAYTNGSTWTSSNDMWHVAIESIYGERLSFNGTF
jgi:hypothetical protein